MLSFDPDKDAANIRKHGVSLALAAELDLDAAVIIADRRENYGEDRFNAFGEIGGQLYALTFTLRGDDVRAISLRRCRAKEVRSWRRRNP